ncbi:MAG: ABC transporter ATP-binding protein [Chloroflexota bacterium]
MPTTKTDFNLQPPATDISIRLVDVSRIYRMGQVQVTALDRVTLDIAAGEFIVLLGPSGSGKTTLLNLVGGLDNPTSGQVIVNGLRLDTMKERELTDYRRRQVGFIFQFFNLIPTLTARENVELAAALVHNGTRSEELLHEVGLGERVRHFPSELSGGENQRVAIARALATDPPVLLCDEPTGSLDYQTGKRIFRLLRDLSASKHKTVIVVTHNSAIGAIAHRVIRLRDGRVTGVTRNEPPLDPEELSW